MIIMRERKREVFYAPTMVKVPSPCLVMVPVTTAHAAAGGGGDDCVIVLV